MKAARSVHSTQEVLSPAAGKAETGGQTAASPLGTRTDGRTDRQQPHLQGVPRYHECTIMLPSKGVQLQMGLSSTGDLHAGETVPKLQCQLCVRHREM